MPGLKLSIGQTQVIGFILDACAWLSIFLLPASVFSIIYGRLAHKRFTAAGITLNALILTFCVFFIVTGFLQPRNLKLTTYRIGLTPGSAPLKYKVVFFSDVHLGIYKGTGWLSAIVDRVNALHPDVILIGGDFVYHPRTPLSALFQPLARLHSTYGSFAVLGNHDYGIPGADVTASLSTALSRYKVKVLKNSAVKIANAFWLVGVDELWMQKDNLPAALHQITGKAPIIILGHNPDILLKNQAQANLWLFGHTHGGQVCPPLFLPTQSRYAQGEFCTPWGRIIVTQGAGEAITRVRWLTQPEIIVIEL